MDRKPGGSAFSSVVFISTTNHHNFSWLSPDVFLHESRIEENLEIVVPCFKSRKKRCRWSHSLVHCDHLFMVIQYTSKTISCSTHGMCITELSSFSKLPGKNFIHCNKLRQLRHLATQFLSSSLVSQLSL